MADINVTVSETTVAVSLETEGSWRWNPTNTRWELSVSGVIVAQIDSSGNMGIKGRIFQI